MSSQKTVSQAFSDHFQAEPLHIVRAPGRVNLIGEHTDYNDGYVLPMAIDAAIWIALRPRSDRRVELHSLDFKRPASFSLDNFTHAEGWEEYIRAIAWVLDQRGFSLQGWEGIISGDIPIGAGLSSSAALELALIKAFWSVSDWEWDGIESARMARRAENEWIGVQSGIMDQVVSAMGVAGHALLIDCRSLETEPVPIPPETCVVVMDTATRRGLVDSAYNQRVAQCQAAATFFGVSALRDVSAQEFHAAAQELDETTRKRARHVIGENQRTLEAAQAMKRGDAAELGRLMDESHDSLRDDYEVSSRELDAIVEAAQKQEGCWGARLTGAGFGGCAVALIQGRASETFPPAVAKAYQTDTGITPKIYICSASQGVEWIDQQPSADVG